MMTKIQMILLLCLCVCGNKGMAQAMEAYEGHWEGELQHAQVFNLRIAIELKEKESGVVQLLNQDGMFLNKSFEIKEGRFEVDFGERLSFVGTLDEKKQTIRGFMQSGILMYHVVCKAQENNRYEGMWNILMLNELASQSFYLSIENAVEENYEAYPFWEDNRFTGTWCMNFQKEQTRITFADFKTGLQFQGELLDAKIELTVLIGGKILTEIDLKPSQKDWNIGVDKNLSKGKYPQKWKFPSLEKALKEKAIATPHSLLIAQKGTLLYERYWEGYQVDVVHDLRSTSKSIASAIMGILIDQKKIKNVDSKLHDLLAPNHQGLFDAAKKEITLHSLLTMSSGLDAIDFGIKRSSKASEMNYQPTPDWTKTILIAPMLYEPSKHANYGSANPHLLGAAANYILGDDPLEIYMDDCLLKPLGISNYIIQTDAQGQPYFGGGMYLTPRDLLKFGQLYMNKGEWEGKQIISSRWVEQSFQNYLPLENTRDKNGYGYLWWHHSYPIKDRTIKTIEARGAGGQYVILIPEKELVVVITSGNFRNGKTKEPELILEKYILPVLLD